MASNQTISRTIRTRLDKDAQPVPTDLTIEMDDPALLAEFAMRAAVIAAQAVYRAAGTIPTSDRMTLSELKKRAEATRGTVRPTPGKVAGALEKMDDATRTATIAALLERFGGPASKPTTRKR